MFDGEIPGHPVHFDVSQEIWDLVLADYSELALFRRSLAPPFTVVTFIQILCFLTHVDEIITLSKVFFSIKYFFSYHELQAQHYLCLDHCQIRCNLVPSDIGSNTFDHVVSSQTKPTAFFYKMMQIR